jgi:hypothetical protein
MEHNTLGLDFAILDIHLVAAQDNGDVFTDAYQVPVPVWYILVCDTSSNIEHNDGTVALNVVAIAQTSKLFLASSVPHIESDGSFVGVEHKRMHLNTKSGYKSEAS